MHNFVQHCTTIVSAADQGDDIMGQTHYVLVRGEDGSLELFRGPFFPNGSVTPGSFLNPDKGDPADIRRGPWRVIKAFGNQEVADLDALIDLIGWGRVRCLFKYSKGWTNW